MSIEKGWEAIRRMHAVSDEEVASMATDTKAVARWDIGINGLSNTAEILWHYQGRYILFTDHERVVGELKNRIDVYDISQVCDKEEIAKQAILIRNKEFTIETLRTALAASRAEVEGLKNIVRTMQNNPEFDFDAAMENGNV